MLHAFGVTFKNKLFSSGKILALVIEPFHNSKLYAIVQIEPLSFSDFFRVTTTIQGALYRTN